MARTSTKTTTAAYEIGNLYQVPPGKLLLQRNIRDSKPDAHLIASVKAIGVVQPITAVLTTDGALLVRYGHRRVLAAVDAARDLVPVYVVGNDDLDDQAEIDRIVGQRDENTIRAGLTAAEEIGTFEQMVAFGMSPDQIVTKSRADRCRVDAALRVSGSKVARATADKYESLTLDQAATVAEFEHDKAVVKELVVTAVQHPDQFAHVAQAARDAVLQENARQELLHSLAQAGVPVIDAPTYENKKVRRLRQLHDDKGKDLTEAKHRTCPGHAAYLTLGWEWVDAAGKSIGDRAVDRSTDRNVQRHVAEFACTDFKKHGHVDTWASGGGSSTPKAADLSDEEREKAKAERKFVIDNNKAWDSAVLVRREWLAEFAKRKTSPKGTGAFLATAIATDRHVLAGDTSDDRTKLCAAWGLPTVRHGYGDRVTVPDNVTEGRALVIALVQVLAAYEAASDRMDWRRNGKIERHGRYLRFLQSAGYGLSDVEKFALSTKTV